MLLFRYNFFHETSVIASCSVYIYIYICTKAIMLTLVNKEINGGKCLLIILVCMRLILYEDSGLCNKFKSSSLHYARIATPTE